MAVVEANDPRVESGANAWSSMLTDAVAKCGRDSERRLYMYGISSNRCPKCQSRLRADNNTCVSCHYSHKTLRKCMRCSQKNDPVMWCAECDAYFCANCHKKPHVLMLGSTKPHHCFPIDGASGKHFVEAAWSDELTEMVRAAYQLRYHDKMQADEAKAKSTEQQATAAVNGAVGQTVSAEGASSTAAPTGTSAVMNGAAGTSSASTATVPPITGAQEQSRKRQLPEQDDGRDKKPIRADESSHSGVKSAAAPTDGMSLYDREQEERAKREADQILQREQHRQQEHERKEQLKQTQKRQKQEQDEQRRQQEEQRLQEIQRQQEEQRWNEEQRRQEDQRRQEERRLQALIQEQQRQRRMMEDRMRHEQMLREQEAREGRFSPSKSGEDDELRAIWVKQHYDPEQLKIQISNLRAQRDSAIKKRFESIVRVLIFSEANEHANIWGDVPAVLTSSHKKCAELAAEIREFECQAQKLREGIDEAVSSGNPAQMQNVAHLGALIADLEQKTRASNGERDKQFIFMFQFSDTVRKMVRAEWAAPGRGLRLQASQ
ncbi:B-box-type zinc finger [Phytophthora cactorum]|nr:B-box-type zinc finger [Phytophthora cactorum]